MRNSPEENFNYRFITDYFGRKDTIAEDAFLSDSLEAGSKKSYFKSEKIILSNCRFIYQNQKDTLHQNTINFEDIDIVIKELETGETKVENEVVSTQIRSLSFAEKSGFDIESLSCQLTLDSTKIDAENLLVRTSKNDLDLDIKFIYNGFEDFDDFIHKVRIDANLRASQSNLYDAGYFAPILFEMDNMIQVSGKISGTVENFKASDLDFSIGKNTHYNGNIQMNGLPDFFETFIHLSIKESTTSYEDIMQFNLPVENHNLVLPEILEKLGLIEIKGKFTGFYNDFVSYGWFNTDVGQLSTDLLLKLNPDNIIEYSGKVSADSLQAGKLFGKESYINQLNLIAEIHGQGLTFETMEADIKCKINSLEFMNTVYDEIILSGNINDKKIKGKCKVSDELISLDINGNADYSQSIPGYDFIAAIRNARIGLMNVIKHDTSMNLSTNLNVRLIGNQFDNLQGIVKIDSTMYFERGESYFMKDFTLSITRDEAEYALIRLFSDFIDASFEGKFLIIDLPNQFNFFLNNYLDTLISDLPFEKNTLQPQDFIFDVELKNSKKLTELFFPQVSISAGTKITGGFNSQIENLFFDASGGEITLYGKKITNWDAEFHIMQDKILLDSKADHVFLTDSLQVDSFNVLVTAARDTIIFSVLWDNNNWDNANYGDLNGYLALYGKNEMKLKFDKGNIVVNDVSWKINNENYLAIDSGSYKFNNIALYSDEQGLKLNGKISESLNDTLVVGFENFNLSSTDKFFDSYGIDLDGTINGDFKILDYFGTPNYLSNITVSDLNFNKEKLGEAVIKSTWNPKEEAFNIMAEIIYTGNIGKSKTLEANGTFYPNKKSNNYDIDIQLFNYKLKTIEPFVRVFSSQVDGLASGQLKLSGSTSKPNLTGEISLMRGKIKIDYLNVSYTLADKFYFKDNLIYFNNVTVYDSLGNQAIASGKIQHDHLRNFKLDLNFNATKLAGLNTTRAQNESFYGTALASGTFRISGPPDNLEMDINITSEKGTSIKIPVSFGAEVTENNYIIFLENNKAAENDSSMLSKYEADLNGLSLKLDMNITHDANIQMFLPYQMGNIQANGKGEIKMRIAPGGTFTMLGEYIINRGSLFLTLQNILNRNFDIRRGSKIAWSGDPYNAQIDLKAVYKVKTKLGDYVPEQDAETPVQVDCIITLSKNLFNPDIKFTIEFPDLKDESKQIIYSQLDTNDQALMSQQMISLLLLNTLYHSSGTSGSVGFNTFSLVTNQLNNWLSKLSDDVNIGVNYRPGTEVSSDEVEVALSTQLFDERVLIDGNLGVKSGSENTSSNNNNLVGEVNVDVKITRDGRFRAKAFNKSNNNYLYKNYAPYTQGVGLFYTEDFNKFGDLFRKKQKKNIKIRQKPPEEQSMYNE